MKTRTRKEIETSIKREQSYLDMVVADSIRRETSDAEQIQKQELFLKELRIESCFEDTFEGKSQEAEKTAFNTISIILEDLSTKTGKEYLLQEALTELMGGC